MTDEQREPELEGMTAEQVAQLEHLRALQAEADAGDQAGDQAEPHRFTVGEKLQTIGWCLTHAQVDSGNLGGLLKMLRNAQRFGLLNRITSELPPLEDEDSWHQLIGLVVGALLSLTSDGVELDLEAARIAGAELLATFQTQVMADGAE